MSRLHPQRPSSPDNDLEQKNAELAALYQVSLAVSQTVDLEKLLSKVLEAVTDLELFSIVKKGGIFLVQDGEMELVSYLGEGHSQGFLDLHKRMKVGHCLCGQGRY
jgi:nitrate/nitrite-specific signal transduction histidine kinase